MKQFFPIGFLINEYKNVCTYITKHNTILMFQQYYTYVSST